jgi:hypothetical protein
VRRGGDCRTSANRRSSRSAPSQLSGPYRALNLSEGRAAKMSTVEEVRSRALGIRSIEHLAAIGVKAEVTAEKLRCFAAMRQLAISGDAREADAVYAAFTASLRRIDQLVADHTQKYPDRTAQEK